MIDHSAKVIPISAARRATPAPGGDDGAPQLSPLQAMALAGLRAEMSAFEPEEDHRIRRRLRLADARRRYGQESLPPLLLAARAAMEEFFGCGAGTPDGALQASLLQEADMAAVEADWASIGESSAAVRAALLACETGDAAMQVLGSVRAEVAALRVALEALARRVGAI